MICLGTRSGTRPIKSSTTRRCTPLLQHSANNVGDPFHDSLYRVNTHEFEREVITIFANLMRHSPDETWGYVTSGGTEGNMYGLYIAREMFPNGVVYFSQDTHYSVRKNLRVLNYRNIMIRSLDNGEIDYEDLRETIRINRHLPVVVMANIGTTNERRSRRPQQDP